MSDDITPIGLVLVGVPRPRDESYYYAAAQRMRQREMTDVAEMAEPTKVRASD